MSYHVAERSRLFISENAAKRMAVCFVYNCRLYNADAIDRDKAMDLGILLLVEVCQTTLVLPFFQCYGIEHSSQLCKLMITGGF